MINPRYNAEGELSMDQTQTGDERSPAHAQATPQSEQTDRSWLQQKPLVTIVHASVGSGHKAAANAIAQAFDLIRGTNGIPEDVEIEVLDILNFGRIKFDGNKTAASFTGATRPIYDLTWRYTLTGHLLWGGGTAWSRIMFPAFNDYVRTPQAHGRGRNTHYGSQCCCGRPRHHGYRLPGHLRTNRL